MIESGGVVLVVDDDHSVRQALKSLIRSVGLRVELFASAQEFLAAERPDAPSCLVLDVRLPGISGLECQRQLTLSGADLPVIFITGHGDIPMSVRAMKAGAVEFLTKPFRDQDLLEAIHVALEQSRATRKRKVENANVRSAFQSLTPREREVMGWVVSGRANRQIATELGTSEITVKMHRGNLMRKMGAGSIADLVRMAERVGVAAMQ